MAASPGPATLVGGLVPDALRERTGRTLVELLERAAARYADDVALKISRGARTERWTYRELLERSESIAALLAARGVLHGDRVVTWTPNDPWLVAAYFGAWRIGAVIVPLDLRMATDVAVRIGLRTRPALLIASPDVAKGPGRDLGVPIVLATAAELGRPPGEPGVAEATAPGLPPPPAPGDLAEILFTSGTTSDPKGVAMTHASLVHDAHAITATAGATRERALALIPMSHMYGQIVPLFHGLSTGCQLTFLAALTPTALFDALTRDRITAITAVPAILELLANSIEREARRSGRLTQLRWLRAITLRLPMPVRRLVWGFALARFGGRLRVLTSGGAPLSADLQNAFEAMGILVIQGYGATEAAAIAGHSRGSRRPGTVGRPFVGMEVTLAEDGELLARGPNMMVGYWERPEETAETLAGGWVHTGDAASVRPDGEIVILGRTRDRIALPNGLKVYPEDIEVALAAQPAVRAAVALEAEPGVLAAVVLPSEKSAPDADLDAAVAAANQALAPHQRVRRWRRWPGDDFPRTHTLKVRRAEVARWLAGEATPAAGMSTTTAPAAAAAPGGPAGSQAGTEEAVLEVVRATLVRTQGREPAAIGLATTVASLGLDSLALVALALAIEERLAVALEVDELAAAADLAAVARLVDARRATPIESREPSRWAFSPPARAARAIIGALLVEPAIRLIGRPRIEGLEHVRGLDRPVLICGNHASHLDAPTVRSALPAAVRRRTAVAAAADYFFEGSLLGPVTALAFGAFPFGRSERVRASLERVASFLDDGWNVVLFPEGTRSPTGAMAPFREGIGLLATDLGASVLPVHLAGTHEILPKGASLPRRRCRVVVRFGPPLTFAPGTSIAAATAGIEAAVRALAANAPDPAGRAVTARR